MNINHLTDIFDKDTEKLMHLLGIEKERNWFSRKNQLPELELIKKYCQSFPTVTENLVVILSTCQGDNEQPTKQLAENLLKNKKIKGSAVNVPSGLTIQKLFLDAITKEKLENIRNFMLDEKNDDFLMKTSQLVSENKINPKEFKKGIKILREIMDEVKDPAELKPALNWFQAKYSPHMDAIVSKLLENNALKNVTPAPGKGQAYYNKYFKTEPDRPWIRRIFSRNKSKTDPKKPGIDYI